MSDWQRRSFIASGAALAASGIFASAGVGEEPTDESREPVDEPWGWSSYRGNAANGAYVEADQFPKPDTVAWQYDVTGDIAASNGWVYVRTDGELHALDAEDGTLKWTQARFNWTPEVFDPTGTPAVAHGRVYTAGEYLTALDAKDGSLEWRTELNKDESVTSPTLAYGNVYVVVDEALYAFDAADGELLWQLDTVGVEMQENLNETITPEHTFKPIPVAVVEERVYAITTGEDYDGLVTLDAHSGETLGTSADRWSSVRGPIVVADDHITVYLGDTDRSNLSVPGDRAVHNSSVDGIRSVTTGEITISSSDYSLKGPGWNYRPGAWKPFGNPLIAGDTGIIYRRGEFEQENGIVGFDIHDGSMKWILTEGEFENVTTSGLRSSQDRRDILSDGITLFIQNDEQISAVRSSGAEYPDDDFESDDGEDREDEDSSESDEDEDPGNDDPDSTDQDDGQDETDTDGQNGDDTSGSDGSQDTDDNQSTGDSGDTGQDNGSQGEDGSDEGDEINGSSENSSNETENTSDGGGEESGSDDAVPGFTTGTSLAGGALSLEWLRRRAATDEPAE